MSTPDMPLPISMGGNASTLRILTELSNTAHPHPWKFNDTGAVIDDIGSEVITGWDGNAPIQLAAAAPDLAAALLGVLNLHKAETIQAITAPACCNEDCEHEDPCPTTPIQVCAECNRIAEDAYPYYGENGLTNVLYPCPTIQAMKETTR